MALIATDANNDFTMRRFADHRLQVLPFTFLLPVSTAALDSIRTPTAISYNGFSPTCNARLKIED
jgi:hypothetical protein